MMGRCGFGLLISLASTSCLAATDLGVPWAGLTISLNIAAARVGGQPLASNGTCEAGARDPCRWTAPGGIAFEAQSDGAGHLERIEADWNSDQHPGDGASFRSACLAIAALVQPHWSRARAATAASKTMAITGVQGSVDERQQVVGGIRLFGDRNAPSQPSRPDGAFLQCGAAPNS